MTIVSGAVYAEINYNDYINSRALLPQLIATWFTAPKTANDRGNKNKKTNANYIENKILFRLLQLIYAGSSYNSAFISVHFLLAINILIITIITIMIIIIIIILAPTTTGQ